MGQTEGFYPAELKGSCENPWEQQGLNLRQPGLETATQVPLYPHAFQGEFKRPKNIETLTEVIAAAL